MFISIKNLSSCKKLREKNPKQGLGERGGLEVAREGECGGGHEKQKQGEEL